MQAADRLARAVRTAAGILLVLVALTMLAVILGRYVGFATAWADEVARLAFLWSACLGAASGAYHGLNFAVALIAPRRGSRAGKLIETGIAALMVVLCALVLWATTRSLPVAHLARLPALGITGAWFHAAVSTFAALTCGLMLAKIAQIWRNPVQPATAS
jgi:TRAP-type C4-dicarboxylate transport system permease small subunit